MSLRSIAPLLVLLGSALSVPPAAAQVDSTAQQTAHAIRLVLLDGTEHVGHIEREDDEVVVLRTLSGIVMTIPKAQIRRREAVTAQRRGAPLTRIDPNRTRLLFAPTARSLRSGEGYVALYEVFLPFAAIGVADVATLGGGISLVPGASAQLLYLAPKVNLIQRPRFSAAVGVFAATLTSSEGVGGLVYGVTTYGTPEAAITGGLGFAFGDGEFEETPILLLGGEYQLSNRVKLLTENYVLPGIDQAQIVSGGIRFMGEHLAADFGLFTSPAVLTDGGFNFLPWMSFAYNFGR